MIKKIWVGCLIVAGITGCREGNGDTVRSFMPGMYVRAIDHEFAKGADTLIIQPVNTTTYEITKRSGFVRVRNGQALPYEGNHETWTGIYDEADQVIREQRKGKVLSFVPKENKLLVGGTAYQKVNP